jgi:hypothetical protein
MYKLHNLKGYVKQIVYLVLKEDAATMHCLVAKFFREILFKSER